MHTVRCRCGAVKGHVLDGHVNNRARCYCRDCQAFGRYFGPDANVLDAQGGTEIVQVSQARLRITQGLDSLAIIRLSDKGLLRWYARCCQTAIGNTMADPKWSFVGLVHTFLDRATMDRDFGAGVTPFHTQSAIGEPRPRKAPVMGSILKFLCIVLGTRLTGRYRQSPLFTASGQPIVSPVVLSREELQRLKGMR